MGEKREVSPIGEHPIILMDTTTNIKDFYKQHDY